MKVLLENLKEKIEEGNADKSLIAIDLVIEKLPSDVDLTNEILSPAIITELHELLIEHLEVAPRAMQLNRRFPNSKTRAVMFAKAMRNGIVHVIK
jgi:hypothetical protein